MMKSAQIYPPVHWLVYYPTCKLTKCNLYSQLVPCDKTKILQFISEMLNDELKCYKLTTQAFHSYVTDMASLLPAPSLSGD